MMRKPGPNLSYKSCWQAPGYRQLTIVVTDDTGRVYDLHIGPKDLQRLINECADAAKQIGGRPPIDWDDHPAQIYWPQISPWIAGPSKETKGGPTVTDPNRPYCKPDQSCCDFCCGN